MNRYPTIKFDKLQMYFREPLEIDIEGVKGKVVVYQPTIGDIVKIGENKFYSTLNVFIANTTSYRLVLWEAGIDWNVISDFSLFCMLYKGIDSDVAKLIFHDLNFDGFQLCQDNEGNISLYNSEKDVEINEEVYQNIAQYLRLMFNSYPEEKITKDATLKDLYIQKDRNALRNAELKKKDDDKSYSIQTLISTCVNHPGFKYKLQELREVGVCEFYDSVKRLQVYESTTACMKGLYSGFVDGSKLKPDDYNFMKEI